MKKSAKSHDALATRVAKGVRALTQTAPFIAWLAKEGPHDGDRIVINNSFVYRKPLITTAKNGQYLTVMVQKGKPDLSTLTVSQHVEFNTDFKRLSAKSQNLPSEVSLDDAVGKELGQIRDLVFLLVGELADSRCEVPVAHGEVHSLVFESTSTAPRIDQIDNGKKTIVVGNLTNPETTWDAIKGAFAADEHLEAAFAAAFEKLQDAARFTLKLPIAGAAKSNDSFMARLVHSVAEQKSLYEHALSNAAANAQSANGHIREAMRIAYNFAEDAVKLLQLLVSVADLKAIVMWCTINEHFALAEGFRALPWTKSHKKPSLERYREIIGGARNRAFHNLFAFDRTIEADLAGVGVRARRLTLLPPYGRKRSAVAFDYEDRELVEIFTELTRAPETVVALDFWQKNAFVMEAFETLLRATEAALWAINRARR